MKLRNPKKCKCHVLEIDVDIAKGNHDEDEVDAAESLWNTDLPTQSVKDPADRDMRYSENSSRHQAPPMHLGCILTRKLGMQFFKIQIVIHIRKAEWDGKTLPKMSSKNI